jgi:hypothetical protein
MFFFKYDNTLKNLFFFSIKLSEVKKKTLKSIYVHIEVLEYAHLKVLI